MPTPVRRRLGFERLEDRDVPSFSPFQLNGGETIAVGDVFPEVGGGVENEYVVGSGKGQQPYVRVFNLAGILEAEFLAYEPTFTGGVNVALADVVTGDNLQEIITGPGFGGGPVVKVFNPASRNVVRSFVAFEASFRGGVNVAGGQLNLVTPAEEVVVGAGFGGGPVVRVFNENGSAFSSFFAYESSFRNGVNLAVGDVLSPVAGANAGEEIVTGPGEGGAPLLKVFGGIGDLRRSYFAFDQTGRNGLVVAAGNTDGALSEEIFAAAQFTPLFEAPRIRSFNGNSSGQIQSDFNPFPAGYTRYINFAVGETVLFPSVLLNAGDLSVMAGEGQINQVPRTFYGVRGSAAGNNGP
ncbi:hypothetical protein [Urbifossiella limnaea]|uniref:Uncharacterized protein n=1 Tax=Urbifossiella limnaea TaxID=2528023 RepID=A0A517XXY3_9BACT|nr:hypothetical protein [Urbifossiella limnaea]QDU22356.1 hypothetical protein ETAA1_43340 [Urbifossiella limnaea]